MLKRDQSTKNPEEELEVRAEVMFLRHQTQLEDLENKRREETALSL